MDNTESEPFASCAIGWFRRAPQEFKCAECGQQRMHLTEGPVLVRQTSQPICRGCARRASPELVQLCDLLRQIQSLPDGRS